MRPMLKFYQMPSKVVKEQSRFCHGIHYTMLAREHYMVHVFVSSFTALCAHSIFIIPPFLDMFFGCIHYR